MSNVIIFLLFVVCVYVSCDPGNYLKARQKAHEAEDTSNVESDDEPETTGLCRRKGRFDFFCLYNNRLVVLFSLMLSAVQSNAGLQPFL